MSKNDVKNNGTVNDTTPAKTNEQITAENNALLLDYINEIQLTKEDFEDLSSETKMKVVTEIRNRITELQPFIDLSEHKQTFDEISKWCDEQTTIIVKNEENQRLINDLIKAVHNFRSEIPLHTVESFRVMKSEFLSKMGELAPFIEEPETKEYFLNAVTWMDEQDIVFSQKEAVEQQKRKLTDTNVYLVDILAASICSSLIHTMNYGRGGEISAHTIASMSYDMAIVMVEEKSKRVL